MHICIIVGKKVSVGKKAGNQGDSRRKQYTYTTALARMCHSTVGPKFPQQSDKTH